MYFIYIPNMNVVIVIKFIYKGNLVFRIYTPNVNDVTVIIFATVIHFGTINIYLQLCAKSLVMQDF